MVYNKINMETSEDFSVHVCILIKLGTVNMAKLQGGNCRKGVSRDEGPAVNVPGRVQHVS